MVIILDNYIKIKSQIINIIVDKSFAPRTTLVYNKLSIITLTLSLNI